MTTGPHALVLRVQWLEGRYHGEPEWPPAPARLFQALVAGAAAGAALPPEDAAALRWLEAQAPPLIAAPPAWSGQAVKLWVPNNDLDAKGGDPAEVASIRTGKIVRPRHFDAASAVIYAWPLDAPDDEGHAIQICDLAARLYQLGRGVDMAWATGSLVSGDALDEQLAAHGGHLHRPSPGVMSGLTLGCPQPGSLRSLEVRHEKSLARFQVEGSGRKAIAVFQQPPKATFAPVPYDAPAPAMVFDVRPVDALTAFSTTPLPRSAPLVEAIRDAAASRLQEALPQQLDAIERGLIGRPGPDHEPPVASEARIRIVPLPSIGHAHVDRGIRRILVEVPAASPLRRDDVFWAFSGLEIDTPVGARAILTVADDGRMLTQYRAERLVAARWRTVTAAALPVRRRRIDPARAAEEAKSAPEREAEEARARAAVVQALRHAGIRARSHHIHVQREPFTAKGARAEAFAPQTRFEKERLWHVEVAFDGALRGPLVIGDGRFLGLGVMEPVEDLDRPLVYAVRAGLAPKAAPTGIATALRRAVLARYQQVIGPRGSIPAFISGHHPEGTREHQHLAFSYDPSTERLLVIPPAGSAGRHRATLRTLHRAMAGFTELRAGAAGALVVEEIPIDAATDPLFGASRRWVTRTRYSVNRHLRRDDAEQAVIADVIAACRKANLPLPEVRVAQITSAPREGLSAHVELTFSNAEAGPILLGRTRNKGGGLFGHAPEPQP